MEPNQTPPPGNSAWTKFLKISLIAYLIVGFLFMVAVILLVVFGFRYFNHQLKISNNNSNSNTTEPTVNITLPADAPILGDAAAPVTIVEYADFQCPFCKAFQDNVFPSLKTKYIDSGQVRFAFQDFAFLGPESLTAAAASKCAAEQQQFWPYHDLLYAKQGDENSGAFSDANLKTFASQLGLNRTDFDGCLSSNKYADAVNAELAAGEGYGVAATPTLFINGKKYEGVGTVSDYEQVIDQALNAK